jgi:hypothetical protein
MKRPNRFLRYNAVSNPGSASGARADLVRTAARHQEGGRVGARAFFRERTILA